MRFISLFAGIGGLDLGLERAGHTCVAQVEWDPYCQAVLAKHWPDVPRWGDIREVRGDELPATDMVVGGFPCQPVSLAGKGMAQADERWLWPEVARVIRDVRPRVALLENVPGLLHRGLDVVLADLAALGFDAEWDSLPAAAIGAPHRRDRVFVVAYPAGLGREVSVFQSGLLPPEVGQAWLGKTTDSSRHLFRRWGWSAETVFCGVGDGFSDWTRRNRALGNAVVPQVAEWIGRRLMSVEGAA